jgi:hypothetical protein
MNCLLFLVPVVFTEYRQAFHAIPRPVYNRYQDELNMHRDIYERMIQDTLERR